MKIVSFTGPKGSGKDTAAEILFKLNRSKGKISFAGPMKRIVANVFNLELASFEDQMKKEELFDEPLVLTKEKILEIYHGMLAILPLQEFNYPDFFSIVKIQDTQLVSRRHLLQFVGTEFIRNLIGADWHVAAAFGRTALSKLDWSGTYCVTDARFLNEYEWLEERFGGDFQGYYVARPSAEIVLAAATHASEIAIHDVRKAIQKIPNHVIKNDSDIEAFQNEILKRKIGESQHE